MGELTDLQRRIDLLVKMAFDQAYVALHPLFTKEETAMPTPEQAETLQAIRDELKPDPIPGNPETAPPSPTPEPMQPTDDYLIRKLAGQAGEMASGAKTATQMMADARKLNKLPWYALTTGQQVERMREVVKQIEHTTIWHSSRLQELSERITALEEHDHSGGKVMIPVISKSRGGGYGKEACEPKVEGWF